MVALKSANWINKTTIADMKSYAPNINVITLIHYLFRLLHATKWKLENSELKVIPSYGPLHSMWIQNDPLLLPCSVEVENWLALRNSHVSMVNDHVWKRQFWPGLFGTHSSGTKSKRKQIKTIKPLFKQTFLISQTGPGSCCLLFAGFYLVSLTLRISVFRQMYYQWSVYLNS